MAEFLEESEQIYPLERKNLSTKPAIFESKTTQLRVLINAHVMSVANKLPMSRTGMGGFRSRNCLKSCLNGSCGRVCKWDWRTASLSVDGSFVGANAAKESVSQASNSQKQCK